MLVPSFFFIGTCQFFRRLKQSEELCGAHGGCPERGAEQAFELGPARFPQSVTCGSCHRGLRLTAAEVG